MTYLFGREIREWWTAWCSVCYLQYNPEFCSRCKNTGWWKTYDPKDLR